MAGGRIDAHARGRGGRRDRESVDHLEHTAGVAGSEVDRGHRVGEGPHGRPAIFGGLGERTGDDRGDGLGDRTSGAGGQQGHGLEQVAGAQVGRARVGEGDAAGEQLVHDDAERVDIGAGVDGAAGDLLGGSVTEVGRGRGRAEARPQVVAEHVADAGAEDLEGAGAGLVADREEVAGLQVEAEQAVLVREVDELAGADHQRPERAPRQRALAGELGRQAVAGKELGDDEDEAVVGTAEVGQLDDVGAEVVAVHRGPGLEAGLEAGEHRLVVRQGGRQDPQGDAAGEGHVLGPVQGPGAAGVDAREEAVAVGDQPGGLLRIRGARRRRPAGWRRGWKAWVRFERGSAGPFVAVCCSHGLATIAKPGRSAERLRAGL